MIKSWRFKTWVPVVGAMLFALLLVLAGCGTPDAGGIAAEQPSGTILFAADGQIFSWDGDITQITHDGHAASPRWAPGGDRIAYVRVYDEDGYSDLIIARPDGEMLRQVTNNRPDGQAGTHAFVRYANWAQDPVWSPSGDHLAFVSDKEGWEAPPDVERYSDPMYLWYADTSDSEPYLLPKSSAIGLTQEWPTFSPDGSQLAFVVRVREDDGRTHSELRRLALQGGELTPLVAGAAAYAPAWSPDGKNIAFIERNGGQNDIWIVPANGGSAYQLTTLGDCAAPDWSPDGRFLAFFRADDSGAVAAWNVELSADPGGRLSASEPHKLFSADGIDIASGLSWSASE